MTEIIFEKYNAVGLFLAKNSTLSCYANGLKSGLVLESGASTTVSSIVYEGYVLNKTICKNTLSWRYFEFFLL